MPWQERHTVSLRQEFVELARREGANVRELCRRYSISPKTAYKWIGRAGEGSGLPAPLLDRSRRPITSPKQTNAALEMEVVRLRRLHPRWGGRKLAQLVLQSTGAALAPSTVTNILHRHELIEPDASERAKPWQRFVHEVPNALWQMDFKGDFATLAGRCHPFTMLDDHSRFNLALNANARTDTAHVQPLLEHAFHRYGLPLRINADNGPPWGSPSAADRGLTKLSIWLIRLGIYVSHSRPYHPQTNGKIERFHQTLNVELLSQRRFADHQSVQQAFDVWRSIYNCERPHEALDLSTPTQHYTPSTLQMPCRLAPIEYPDTDTVLTVGWNGFIKFNGRKLRTSTALHRLPIGIRVDPAQDGVYEIYFCHQRFMSLDMAEIAPDH